MLFVCSVSPVQFNYKYNAKCFRLKKLFKVIIVAGRQLKIMDTCFCQKKIVCLLNDQLIENYNVIFVCIYTVPYIIIIHNCRIVYYVYL